MSIGTASTRPLADGLFTWPSESPRLLGSRCEACSTMTFPVHYGCPRCSSAAMATVELGTSGTVWTWTSQGFPPPPPYAGPADFVPYYVGYVELPGELIVETYLTGYTADQPPAIGDAVELTIVPFTTVEPDGEEGGEVEDPVEIVTYAFAPIGGGS